MLEKCFTFDLLLLLSGYKFYSRLQRKLYFYIHFIDKTKNLKNLKRFLFCLFVFCVKGSTGLPRTTEKKFVLWKTEKASVSCHLFVACSMHVSIMCVVDF